jgi:hypothetical protein
MPFDPTFRTHLTLAPFVRGEGRGEGFCVQHPSSDPSPLSSPPPTGARMTETIRSGDLS